jgi:hypothetical protein
MRTSPFFAMVLVLIASAPLFAQQANDLAGDSAKTTYAAATAGFGDEAASRSWEMTDVKADLDGKLDSKSAKVGDRVVLKTEEKVQSSDGVVIPRGSRIVGHITAVQAHNNDRAIAQIEIAFDHAELKNGQSIPIHTLIRSLRPVPSVSSMSMMDNDTPMNAGPMGAGMGGGAMGGRTGGGLGGGTLSGNGSVNAGNMGAGNIGAGNVAGAQVGGVPVGGVPGAAGGTLAGSGAAAGTAPGLGAGVNANENSEVQMAGHGAAPVAGGAHAAAAERAVPHPTEIPGVMLAGSSTASGLLIYADRGELTFTSGTRFELGVVADR